MLVRIVTDKGILPLEGFTPEYRRRCTVSVHLVSRYTLCGALGFLFGNRTARERAPRGFVIYFMQHLELFEKQEENHYGKQI